MVHRGVLSASLRPGLSELAGQGLWRLQFALDRLVAWPGFSRVICPVRRIYQATGPDGKRLHTVAETAQTAGVHRTTVYDYLGEEG